MLVIFRLAGSQSCLEPCNCPCELAQPDFSSKYYCRGKEELDWVSGRIVLQVDKDCPRITLAIASKLC